MSRLDPGPAWCLGGACPHDHPERCESCDGSGAVTADDGLDEDCPACDGSGWL